MEIFQIRQREDNSTPQRQVCFKNAFEKVMKLVVVTHLMNNFKIWPLMRDREKEEGKFLS